MYLADHIERIKKGIREGQYTNEASVSQGIVLRILQTLGWPTFDTQVVWPEYPIEGRRVDYALCHPNNKPRVLIEVKMIGKHNYADKQLFEYAFHLGIPMAILTDGPEWHFFLPTEQGSYQDRRVYTLDILERDTDEIVDRFNRYLQYERVRKKDAISSARQDYRDVAKSREIKETLPVAWSSLVNEPDDMLVELLIEKVESLCGYRPTETSIANFLANRESLSVPDVAGLPVEQEGEDEVAVAVDAKYTSPFSCVDRRRLPAGLADVLEVCLEVYENGKGYNAAVRELFERRNLKSIHTIYDKCTRSLDLDTEGFKALLAQKTQISSFLQEKYPDYSQDIKECL